eukprot:m51a1_g11868 hypothetical protein (401) ;mRNA; r:531046-532502
MAAPALTIKAYHTLPADKAPACARAAPTKDGREVRIVVKNQTFLVELSVSPGCTIDLSRACVSAELLYDCAGLKPVAYVRQRPLEYFTSSATHGECVVELRAKVLTSQHEDSLFRIRFTAMDSTAMVSADVISDPVRSISKAETNARRAKAASASAAAAAAGKACASSSSAAASPQSPEDPQTKGRKRTRSTPVEQAAKDKIEELQKELKAQLEENQAKRQRTMEPRTAEAETQTADAQTQGEDEADEDDDRSSDERVSKALATLIREFTKTDPEERQARVQKAVSSLNDTQSLVARALVDAMYTAVFPLEDEQIVAMSAVQEHSPFGESPMLNKEDEERKELLLGEVVPQFGHEEMMGRLLMSRGGPDYCEEDALQQFPSWQRNATETTPKGATPSLYN